jgi:nitroimidazol reductase NimA-like FMN-containing flavoprotein (pyridoxamine 5'-phosphate oxidase superfamily)
VIDNMADKKLDTTRAVPKRSRPNYPGYGIRQDAEGLIEWAWVDQQMSQSRNYWISSVRPDGRPHAVPVWGIWLDGVLYFGSGRNAQKTRNLLANPAVVVHGESGDETVIFEGTVSELDHSHKGIYTALAAGYAAKYPPFKPEPGPDPEALTFVLQPTRVMAWLEKDYPNTATIWQLDPKG